MTTSSSGRVDRHQQKGPSARASRRSPQGQAGQHQLPTSTHAGRPGAAPLSRAASEADDDIPALHSQTRPPLPPSADLAEPPPRCPPPGPRTGHAFCAGHRRPPPRPARASLLTCRRHTRPSPSPALKALTST
ncbi:REST corepressor 2-like [Choloepus didactylus]|uniref:REST corepressor 2-like n=1 Tax=Choloepus didactylus TaxID=27675 RepID=UPI00189F6082|nr:REST corepressor 2-like [Choloepus didactylus]